MSSISFAHIPKVETGVNQGDVFRDVRYAFIDSENDESIEIVEYTFPYAIVVSQSCDVCFMDEFESSEEKVPLKFMPSILMCPIYSMNQLKTSDHLAEIYREMKYTYPAKPEKKNYLVGDDRKVMLKDQHVRFHHLSISLKEPTDKDGTPFISDAVLDFKHVFSLPMKQLRTMRRLQRVCTLDDLYIDQIVNKMCAYISRIGLPV